MPYLAAIIFLSCLPAALVDFAAPKWNADKNVRIEDAYKYLYQATRGGEHAAPDRESARKWLDDEWQALGPDTKHEPKWEPLCPGGEIGRLNLRPFRDGGGKADDLLDAFLASAGEYKETGTNFLDAWGELGKRLEKAKIGQLDHKAWKKLDRSMKKKIYPAIHHSDTYNKANRPAYRVLTRFQATRLIPS
jgi:hypothetical protein